MLRKSRVNESTIAKFRLSNIKRLTKIQALWSKKMSIADTTKVGTFVTKLALINIHHGIWPRILFHGRRCIIFRPFLRNSRTETQRRSGSKFGWIWFSHFVDSTGYLSLKSMVLLCHRHCFLTHRYLEAFPRMKRQRSYKRWLWLGLLNGSRGNPTSVLYIGETLPNGRMKYFFGSRHAAMLTALWQCLNSEKPPLGQVRLTIFTVF